MAAIQLVVFDMAGTTVRDNGQVAVAFMEACKHYGIIVEKEEVVKVMGFRKVDAIKILLKIYGTEAQAADEVLIENIHERFTTNLVKFYEQDPDLQPQPHAEETFKWLHEQGIKTALNTGFTKVITDTILQRLGWNDHSLIDFAISSDEVQEGRPHPFMIRAIMDKLNVSDAAAILKIGDTEVDIAEGRNAGCGKVISVTTGAYTRTQLEEHKPDAIIDSLSELPSLIK